MTSGVLFTPLSLATLVFGAGGGRTELLARLGAPVLEGDPELREHGVRELLARDLLSVEGGATPRPVPEAAAVGVALAGPAAVVTLLAGIEGAGSTIVVEGSGLRCLIVTRPGGVLHVSLLQAEPPLSQVIAGMIRAGCSAPSSAGIAIAASRTGAESDERPVALRCAAGGGFEVRLVNGPAPSATSIVADDELEGFIADLL